VTTVYHPRLVKTRFFSKLLELDKLRCGRDNPLAADWRATIKLTHYLTSRNYIREAAKCGLCLRVQWHPWGCRTPGCCITVSAGLVGVVSAAVKQTTKLMGWQLEE
jgi:hypothetical protein